MRRLCGGFVPLSNTLLVSEIRLGVLWHPASIQLKHTVAHLHAAEQTRRRSHVFYPWAKFALKFGLKCFIRSRCLSAWLVPSDIQLFNVPSKTNPSTWGVIIPLLWGGFRRRRYRPNARRTSVFLPALGITFTGNSSFITLDVGRGIWRGSMWYISSLLIPNEQ